MAENGILAGLGRDASLCYEAAQSATGGYKWSKRTMDTVIRLPAQAAKAMRQLQGDQVRAKRGRSCTFDDRRERGRD
jgi:hypothetical protein